MPATVTTLDREIALEEGASGFRPTSHSPTRAIARRRTADRVSCSARADSSRSSPRFAAAMRRAGRRDRARRAVRRRTRWRRTAISAGSRCLRGDSMRISLVVANELMSSGALAGDRELLDLRDGDRTRGRAARGRSGRRGAADCTRLRLLGPSGEVPSRPSASSRAPAVVPDDASRGARRAAAPASRCARSTVDDRRCHRRCRCGAATRCVGAARSGRAPGGDRYRPRRRSRWSTPTRAARSRRSLAHG